MTQTCFCFIDEITGLVYAGLWGTSTGAAIQLAHEEINYSSSDDTPKIIVILTDGRSNDDHKAPADNAR